MGSKLFEIKGCTAEEVAKSEKEKLESDYDFCESKWQEVIRHEKEIETIKRVYREKISKYRRDSVNRVLSYIRHKEITDSKVLDKLLCHCQNKLNGNIDGVELELDYDKE